MFNIIQKDKKFILYLLLLVKDKHSFS